MWRKVLTNALNVPPARRILVIEDEARIARFISSGLAAEGYEVCTVGDGETALARLAAVDPELVILDLLLPGMDGLDVLCAIRERHPSAAVIVLSARRDVPTKIAGLRAGASDYMVKPFSFDELLERIRIHTQFRSALIDEPFLRSADLMLDLRARTVDVGNGPIPLTDREFRILEQLVRNAGGVVSRARLLSAVWGYSHEPETNVVDVFIRRLRRKIGAECIETVRGAGYRVSSSA
jgi:DNA-binding response OmpR family regulator